MLGKIDKLNLPRPNLTRRGFLQVAGLSGAGFMIGCSDSSDPAAVTDAVGPEALSKTVMGPFIRIGSDNTVTVLMKHLDKGQGVTTGLPTIVAGELDADWSPTNQDTHEPIRTPTTNFSLSVLRIQI